MPARAPVVFFEADQLAARPFTRFRSIFSYRDGIYTAIDRARQRNSDSPLVYLHADAKREALIARVEGLHAFREFAQKTDCAALFGGGGDIEAEIARIAERFTADPEYLPEIRGCRDIITPAYVPVLKLLRRLPRQIAEDLGPWRKANLKFLKKASAKRFKKLRCEIVGDPDNLHVHKSATILPGSVFDTTEGPIVIDRQVQMSPFCYIEGPAYIGPDARVDNLRLTGGSVLGAAVRAGGEIENSIFDAFSNKHHEGFVGHSLLGRWVNLGALTTTSDLKNNYGSVRLSIDTDPAPAMNNAPAVASGSVRELTTVDTGTIKFGSLIGDCVKTAIGTMLNTGTVLDAGSNVFGGSPPKYLPPLRWGVAGAAYQNERFLADCAKIFARRKQTPPDELRDLLALIG